MIFFFPKKSFRNTWYFFPKKSVKTAIYGITPPLVSDRSDIRRAFLKVLSWIFLTFSLIWRTPIDVARSYDSNGIKIVETGAIYLTTREKGGWKPTMRRWGLLPRLLVLSSTRYQFRRRTTSCKNGRRPDCWAKMKRKKVFPAFSNNHTWRVVIASWPTWSTLLPACTFS